MIRVMVLSQSGLPQAQKRYGGTIEFPAGGAKPRADCYAR